MRFYLRGAIPVYLIIHRWRSYHQSLRGGMYLHDGVVNAAWEATELSWPNAYALPFHLDNQSALEDDKALVTLLVRVRDRINPTLKSVVVPNLESL